MPKSLESLSESDLHYFGTTLIKALTDLQRPSDAQCSPDGKYVAFVFGQLYKDAQDRPPRRAIHLVEVATGKMRLFTGAEKATNEAPRWSPDSRKLAFLSNRADPDEMQVYLMPVDGGEARQLTDLRGKAQAPTWSPDGRAIAFLYDGTLSEEKPPDPDPIVQDADPHFNRVWTVEAETGKISAKTPETAHIHEYAWSPDGTMLAVVASSHPNPMEGWYSARLYTVNLATGDMQPVCAVANQLGRLAWSPDSATIAFVSSVMSDEGNIAGDVYVVPAQGGEPRCLTPGIDFSVTWITWRDEGIVYGGRKVDSAVLGWIDPQTGETRLIASGRYAVNGLGPQCVSCADDGTFAAIRSGFTEPPNVYLGALDGGEWRQLTTLPVDAEIFPPLQVEDVYWEGRDGTRIHGFLVLPPGYTPGQPYPMFVHVHGGPTWCYVPEFYYTWERLLAARGCLVFMPNPRGSWGRGHAFQAGLVGDVGGVDWQDITAGIDQLVAEEIADLNRLAVGGWSYGGYLTTWAVTQTDRFRCAIAGASITNYVSNYGVVLNREWQTTMLGSNVYDDLDHHRARSPISNAQRVKTPTLLVHGQEDTVAPPQQPVEFYVALRYLGVPAQLVLYPREPHGFRENAHAHDLLQRVAAWVDCYLLEGDTEARGL